MKHHITLDAATCPHCGEGYPETTNVLMFPEKKLGGVMQGREAATTNCIKCGKEFERTYIISGPEQKR